MTDGDRLDSWKAIAAYLKRDERTVRRWEKTLGLPVRRVSGGRGHSVFALTSEIDTWLLSKSLPLPERASSLGSEGAQPDPSDAPAPTAYPRYAAASILGMVFLAACAAWITLRPTAAAADLQVDFTPTAFVAKVNGREQWRHEFTGERVEVPNERQRHPADILDSMPRAVVTATAWQIATGTETVRSGQVLSLSPAGALVHSFALDDRLAFGAGAYGEPWGINDFRVYDAGGERRIAVAAHHVQWWPGIVTVLDSDLRRRGTFVNAGWLERVHWLSSDRLVVSGFSNARDGGVVALLDAGALDGQSPAEPGSPYYCQTCGDARPLRYIVMPRSELNRVTGARFNRARFEVHDRGITVRTYEMQVSETDAADALYEFTPSLDLVNASFSERYWEAHRALELQGRIGHTRDQCPDRDGPREIQVWEPRQGWRTVPTAGRPRR